MRRAGLTGGLLLALLSAGAVLMLAGCVAAESDYVLGGGDE